MRALILVVFVGALVVPEVAEARRGIRGVDWANRNYGRKMRLKNGRYTLRRYRIGRMRRPGDCLHTTEASRLRKVRYADLNGDGRLDALVEISWHRDYCFNRYGGRVFIAFTYRRGKPVELARLDLSEVTAVRLRKGRLHVQQREAHKGKWRKCTRQYRLKGKAFSRIKQTCK